MTNELLSSKNLSKGNSLAEHFWQGAWIDTRELEKRLAHPNGFSSPLFGAKKLELSTVFEASQKLSQEIKVRGELWNKLRVTLKATGKNTDEEIDSSLMDVAEFLQPANLRTKVRRELGSLDPFVPRRVNFAETVFESWAPLGWVVHVAPLNAFTAGPLSVIEGLLSGNYNFLKTSGEESLFPQLLLEALVRCDATESLKSFVIAARISSRQKDLLKQVFSFADGIAIWGGEEAVQAVKELAPPSVRIVDWGHKISLMYVAREFLHDDITLLAAAREICQIEQQACSSPQCMYVEVDSFADLQAFGERFGQVLGQVSALLPQLEPTAAEASEITLVTELCKLESCLDLTQVIESPDSTWRVLLDSRSSLTPSPLFRTIWIKPLPRQKIASTLWPMRAYLQTVGLACHLSDTIELRHAFQTAGALRIRQIGQMLGSYSGEAHDGVYALQRYCKRVSIQLGAEAKGLSTLGDLEPYSFPTWSKRPAIMTKEKFQSQTVADSSAELFFKSGGSTGEPKLSVFTYEDYHDQMNAGADGLFAAGLDPIRDRSMNLFFGGGLYGGFLSFFTVLESLNAVQFPMSAHTDLKAVAESIVKYRVNALLGMPSYLIQLFEQERAILKNYRGIQKIFYGGEHINEAQRNYFQNEFGVTLIRSAGYGSVDAGPLGYSCAFSENGNHHLHQRLQYLEIVDLESDQPVEPHQVGRLIFTSRVRQGQKIERYDLGDVGYWLSDPCPCGRSSPRFRLLGRSGDIFRIGTAFFNYQRISQIITDQLAYSGAIQVNLSQKGNREKLTVLLSAQLHHRTGTETEGQAPIQTSEVTRLLLDNYKDLHEMVEVDKVLDFEVRALTTDTFVRTRGSGKLVRIVDERSTSAC
jgi:phenylacetate-coenzyme A ligase PaaK-like adenylate-forming protein